MVLLSDTKIETLFNRSKNNSLKVAERESSLKLFYPKKGIGAIADKLTDIFSAKGGVMKLKEPDYHLITLIFLVIYIIEVLIGI